MEPYDISPADAAELVGVHEETIKRWARAGKIAAFRTPGGWWRFRKTDLEAFVAKGRAEAAPTEQASA